MGMFVGNIPNLAKDMEEAYRIQHALVRGCIRKYFSDRSCANTYTSHHRAVRRNLKDNKSFIH